MSSSSVESGSPESGSLESGEIDPLDPDHRPAAQCQTMPQVRAEIDRIDRLLARLLAERQSYMNAAARIKADRSQVRDEARINDVLEKVKRAAAAEGLSWAIAEPVWRVLMERCIAYEFAAYDALREPVSANS